MACYWLNQSDTKITIPGVEDIGNVTYYKISVQVKEFSWSVSHRYSEFYELHNKIVVDHGVNKDLLPPKKALRNKTPEFIETRRIALEGYLQDVQKYLKLTMPRLFLQFLDFHIYDIFFLLQNMAYYFYQEADCILSSSKAYIFNPLQLHAISQCCKIPFPETEETDKRYDLSHAFDFCSQLQQLIINGKSNNYILSNIIPNKLPFELSSFKSLRNLKIQVLSLDNVYSVGNLRSQLESYTVCGSDMTNISQILQCDILHKSTLADLQKWTSIKKLDLSDNELNGIDESINLAPNVETLILNNNKITSIGNLSALAKLSSLYLSNNAIASCEELHAKLGNVVTLDLSRNRLSSLASFSRLFSLESLDVGCNALNDINEVRYIGGLPCIGYVVLTGNAIATAIDYRIHVLEHFSANTTATVTEICLDNEKPSQQELDKVALLRALRIVKEGRTPDLQNSFYKA